MVATKHSLFSVRVKLFVLLPHFARRLRAVLCVNVDTYSTSQTMISHRSVF